MKTFENYNNAKQKYGVEVVNSLSKLGLPPKYLLSACRFCINSKVPQQRIVNLFKEWQRYVAKYNNIDVNRLSYNQFYKLIAQEKGKHCIPNIIFQNSIASLGKINNAKDVNSIQVKNQWCIKSQRWFDRYTAKGYEFFVIYLPQEQIPFTYVIAAVVNGNVEYYNTYDYQQYEDLRPNGNLDKSEHEAYQRKLPQQIISFLYNVAANQTEQKELNNENKIYNIYTKKGLWVKSYVVPFFIP